MYYSQAQAQGTAAARPPSVGVDERHEEPVRSRWTPKPEQILILESIFNSGMVNPPKNETVRIRKMLEKFGSVGDANVFYWFQNRRSRLRRRHRQIQLASLAQGEPNRAAAVAPNSNLCVDNMTSSCSSLVHDEAPSSSNIINFHDFFSYSSALQLQPLLDQTSSHPSNLQYQYYSAGVITVFINGVATNVSRGAFDIKAMFGGDFVLFHSSGMPLQVNDYGFLVHSLQHGESYFLVPRNS
ncbi:WUSCHEL-related homeobox 11-like [Henckelia pumila]|uniref:WUSCHEL-related homeobox 11-like n=1 Tax=Henckelia pumila TaxID=405737 RepID=UPI003C6E7F24